MQKKIKLKEQKTVGKDKKKFAIQVATINHHRVKKKHEKYKYRLKLTKLKYRDTKKKLEQNCKCLVRLTTRKYKREKLPH